MISCFERATRPITSFQVGARVQITIPHTIPFPFNFPLALFLLGKKTIAGKALALSGPCLVST
jgi:hypothetical protein